MVAIAKQPQQSHNYIVKHPLEYPIRFWLLVTLEKSKQNVIQLEKQHPPTLHHIIRVATEYINIRKIYRLAPQVTITHHIKWYSPTAPYIKLNIDGAFTSSNKHGGAGGIFRDSDGKWLLGFSYGFHCSSSNQAEFMALKKGLELANTLGIKDLEINSDSKVFIQSLIKNNALLTYFLFYMIADGSYCKLRTTKLAMSFVRQIQWLIFWQKLGMKIIIKALSTAIPLPLFETLSIMMYLAMFANVV